MCNVQGNDSKPDRGIDSGIEQSLVLSPPVVNMSYFDRPLVIHSFIRVISHPFFHTFFLLSNYTDHRLV